jgi:hypothetical protein
MKTITQVHSSKFNTMSNLIKEGYFNLNTMLNLKSLWMSLARIHPTRAYDINKESMI